MRSCRIGKSWRISRGSRGRFDVPRSGTTSGRKSPASISCGKEPARGRSPSGSEMLPDAPGTAGRAIVGSWAVLAEEPASGAGSARISASVGVFVGAEEGSTGIPGGDCAPGAPGKENISLTDGNFGAVTPYTDRPASTESSATGATAGNGAESAPDNDSVAFVGRVTGLAGIVLEDGCDAGTHGGVTRTSGAPGTEAPGARGNEYASLCPGKLGAAAHGSVLPPVAESMGAGYVIGGVD